MGGAPTKRAAWGMDGLPIHDKTIEMGRIVIGLESGDGFSGHRAARPFQDHVWDSDKTLIWQWRLIHDIAAQMPGRVSKMPASNPVGYS